jgi:hypothetical protein
MNQRVSCLENGAVHSEFDKPEVMSCTIAEAFVSCGLGQNE